jgi:GT2 family glycosyltransferase
METPLVSVVIVTWNRKQDVLVAVQSVYAQCYHNAEVIVVDNGSSDGTVEALAAAYPSATIIALGSNLGASAGRNPGIAAARGEIVMILDSDASLGTDTLVQVVDKFQAEPSVGVLACKVVNATTRQLDRHAGWIYSEKDKVDQDREFLSYSFSECGCAFRKEVFERAGVFSDWLFFGREGEELSLRIWDAGYRILYYPSALVYHRVSPQQQVIGGRRAYFDLRNALSLSLLRYPWWLFLFMTPLRVAAAFLRAAKRRQLGEILRALLDVVRQLPLLLRQRRPIRNDVARQYFGLLRQHGPLRWDLASWLKFKAGYGL